MLAIELLGCHAAGYNRRISKECCKCRAYWYRNWAYVTLCSVELYTFVMVSIVLCFWFFEQWFEQVAEFSVRIGIESHPPLCAIINDHFLEPELEPLEPHLRAEMATDSLRFHAVIITSWSWQIAEFLGVKSLSLMIIIVIKQFQKWSGCAIS